MRRQPNGGTFHIEDVQDSVELALMRHSQHDVARAYVLYRERRAQERARQGVPAVAKPPELYATEGGQRVPLDFNALRSLMESACADLGPDVLAEPILAETRRNLYDGVPMDEVFKAAILAARAIDIPVVGIDFIVPSPRSPDYVFIEANERPGLANHAPQPTAERFVDLLFPNSMPASARAAALPGA